MEGKVKGYTQAFEQCAAMTRLAEKGDTGSLLRMLQTEKTKTKENLERFDSGLRFSISEIKETVQLLRIVDVIERKYEAWVRVPPDMVKRLTPDEILDIEIAREFLLNPLRD